MQWLKSKITIENKSVSFILPNISESIFCFHSFGDVVFWLVNFFVIWREKKMHKIRYNVHSFIVSFDFCFTLNEVIVVQMTSDKWNALVNFSPFSDCAPDNNVIANVRHHQFSGVQSICIENWVECTTSKSQRHTKCTHHFICISLINCGNFMTVKIEWANKIAKSYFLFTTSVMLATWLAGWLALAITCIVLAFVLYSAR